MGLRLVPSGFRSSQNKLGFDAPSCGWGGTQRKNPKGPTGLWLNAGLAAVSAIDKAPTQCIRVPRDVAIAFVLSRFWANEHVNGETFSVGRG